MQLTGQNNGEIASSPFLLARERNWLARTCIMNMRNATCVGTQTSKVPTRVTLLFIPYTVAEVSHRVALSFLFLRTVSVYSRNKEFVANCN